MRRPAVRWAKNMSILRENGRSQFIELAGVESAWLTPSTCCRIRQRIRASTPAELATAIGVGRLVIAGYVTLEMLAVRRIARDAVSEFADRRRDGLSRPTSLRASRLEAPRVRRYHHMTHCGNKTTSSSVVIFPLGGALCRS